MKWFRRTIDEMSIVLFYVRRLMNEKFWMMNE